MNTVNWYIWYLFGKIAIDYDNANEYNITFSWLITFNTSFNDSELIKICIYCFGQQISTNNTIANISSIYDNILHLIVGYNSDGIITKVL